MLFADKVLSCPLEHRLHIACAVPLHATGTQQMAQRVLCCIRNAFKLRAVGAFASTPRFTTVLQRDN